MFRQLKRYFTEVWNESPEEGEDEIAEEAFQRLIRHARDCVGLARTQETEDFMDWLAKYLNDENAAFPSPRIR